MQQEITPLKGFIVLDGNLINIEYSAVVAVIARKHWLNGKYTLIQFADESECLTRETVEQVNQKLKDAQER